MTYRGMIRNGSVVFEEGIELPDGAEVEVALAVADAELTSTRVVEGKRQLWQALRTLPEKTSFEDIVEEVYLLYKIERGLRQLGAGEGVPHEEARKRFNVQEPSPRREPG